MTDGIPPKLDTDAERRAAIRRFGALLVTFALAGGTVTAGMWQAAERPPIERSPLQAPATSSYQPDAGDASAWHSAWPTTYASAAGRCVSLTDASVSRTCEDPDWVVIVDEISAVDAAPPPSWRPGVWLAPPRAIKPCCPIGLSCAIRQNTPPDGLCAP